MRHILKNTLSILTHKERQRLWLLIILDFCISIADILFLALLLFIIHLYTQPGASVRYPLLPSWLYDRSSLLPISLFFLLFSLKNLVGFLIYRAQSRFICEVASRLSQNKLSEYQEGMYANYIGVDSSVQTRKISFHPLEFCQHILGGIQQIITQSALIALTIAAIVFFNARLFLLLFVILLPPVFAVFYLVKNKLRAFRAHVVTTSEKAAQHLNEALSGFVESNIYNKNGFFLQRYITYQRRFNRYLSDLITIQGIPPRMIEIFALLGLFILVSLNKWSGSTDNTAIITVGAFMAASYKIIPGIVKIVNLVGQVNTYSFTIKDLLSPVITAPSPGNNGCSAHTIQSIRFEKIRFQYDHQVILDKLDLCIAQGDFLGISGHSGKGKTTILNLLLGFLTPVEGQIMVNGRTTGSLERRQYWHRISYVKQQSFLLHDTIARNIMLDSGHYDEQKLREVIRIAGLTDLIDTFPEGWDKMIAENGKNISGGQRQRIAMARALYKDADLVVLDEPFNELDEAAELSLLHHFQGLAQSGKLVILITHNKKSLSFCSKILSLDEK